jgi:cytochrome c-type biogenesis protein CcmF
LGEIGAKSIWFAIAALLLAILFYVIAGSNPRRMAIANALFVIGCGTFFVPFAAILTLFIRDQFQFQYVFNHGDTITELKYKIAGVWTAQEGSFLLWAVCTSLFGLLTLRGSGVYRRAYASTFAVVLCILGGILAFESPFGLLKDVVQNGEVLIPPRGNGMVPSLQNYWVVIHPPVIFLGFGALTIFFAYGVAALIHQDAKQWIALARPWGLAILGVLGLGICMGGLWAYETQGWGGFWAWDPVENVSLVPWLFLVILVHGFIVQTARGKWAIGNLWLSGLPFISFVYGTFLTRSGLLDKVSVHSFASMNGTALQILRIALITLTVAFVGLAIWRAKTVAMATVEPQAEESGVTRESGYRFGMLLFLLLGAVIALGMSWPVITALQGGQGSRVEEWLYHQVVVWFFIPIMFAMAAVPFISWRGMGWKALLNRIANCLSLAIGATGFLYIGMMDTPWGVRAHAGTTVRNPFGGTWPMVPVVGILVALCFFVAITAGWRAIELSRKWGMTVGGFVAHVGFALLLGGLIISRGFEMKQQVFVQSGAPANALDYIVTFKELKGKDLFDRDAKAVFELEDPKGEKITVEPGLYYYNQNEEVKPQVWPYVKNSPTHDVYFALFPPVTDVWEVPQTFRVKEKREIDGITVEYLEPTTEGEPGTAGAKFGAKMRITTRTGTYDVNPKMELTEGGIQPVLTAVGTEFFAVLGRMDAGTRNVDLKLLFQKPLYPVEVYYKPLTILVWVGTGILTIGGLMAAFGRRRRIVAEREPKPVTMTTGNATQTATQS